MSTIKNKISVVMPTLNCAKILERSLSSVSWADEIIVVDMGSTDGTKEIAQNFKAKFFTKKVEDGNFDKNRKYGMLLAKGDWILKLDSDEELSVELQEEILNLMKNPNNDISGYYLKNRIYMFGKEVKHGFVKPHSSEMRLVKKGHWSYNPYRFHQQIVVKGKVGVLKNYYYHYNYSSVAQFLKKMNNYSTIDATQLTHIIKTNEIIIAMSFFSTLFKFLILQKGFIDGILGLKVSLLFSMYYMVEKIKVWEIKKYESWNY